MAKERRVEIRMPSELLRQIDDQADREGKSRSEMIRFMAEIYLRDADANRLIDRTQSYESSFRHKGPWVANDLVFKREWVLPEPLRYYVVRDREAGTWFICERFGDVAVPGTLAKTRDAAIKAFYKWVRREIPDDVPIETPSVRPAEQ